MKGKKSQNLLQSLVAGMIAVALLVSGAFFFGADGNVVIASASETTTVQKNADGYYVKPYAADKFASFRGDTYTYPKLTVADGSDYQEWLFAGWFTDNACTAESAIESSVQSVSGEVYAKFVDADLSYVKCQVTPGTEKNSELAHMRLISAVESNDYSGTGFYITYKGREPRRCPSTTVYRRLSATEDGMECAYSPIAFNEDAEYLSAIRLTDIANTNYDEAFYIQSYWVTLDGTEVLGMSRYARIEDSYEKIVNVPVRLYASDVNVTSGSVSVSYEADQFSLYTTDEYNGYDDGKGFTVTNVDSTTTTGKITVTGTATNENGVAEGLFINLRLKLKEGATLEAYTEFTVDDENFEGVTDLDVSNVIFKNYPLAYNGTPDTSWYKGFENNKTFVITSAADLYGFASIVNAGTDTFKDNTVYLGADITVNKGQATTDGWITTKDVNGNEITDGSGTEHKWIPIGYTATAAKRFQGTFDGCGNTIEGIYCTDDYATGERYTGLFGITVYGSTVRNFKLTNSIFESKAGYSNVALMGSIVGQLAGDMDTVYSNSIVKSAFIQVGGMVGRTQPGDASRTCYIKNCWYDGNVTVNEAKCSSTGVGGIVGYVFRGKVELTDCMNTAKITYKCDAVSDTIATNKKQNIGVAGLVGNGAATMNNCINTVKATATLPTGITVQGIDHNGTRTNCIDLGVWKTSYTLDGCNGYLGYTTAKELGFGFYDFETGIGNWVCRPTADSAIDGIPVLKSFCDEWIDVSWYYDDTKAPEFTIDSAEALYGWSELSNKANINFASDVTVKLGADIKMNSGNASVWATTTNTNITDALRDWTPIKSLAGTFDGQMHTISGIYLSTTTANAGLFGEIATGGSVSNLYIKDSYFKSTATDLGSVAGVSNGIISKVYSEAIIVSSNLHSGGIVGSMATSASAEQCWFNGKIILSGSNGKQAGGIVGYLNTTNKSGQTFSITDCLYTGDMTFTVTSTKWALRIGGIIGGAWDTYAPTINITNCMNAGTMMHDKNSANVWGASMVYGGFDQVRNTVLNLTNVYATNECFTTQRIYHKYDADNGTTSETPAINGEGTLIAESDLYGTWGYQNTLLDFDNTWAARSNGVPGLKAFVDAPISVADTIQPDTRWYDAEETELQIQNAADMYGFMKLLAEGNTFEEQTVTVMDNLVMNPTEEDTVSKWQAGSEVPNNKWVSSYTGETTNFAGTFNGNEKTISGIYCVGDYEYLGLFGTTLTGSTVKNFKLTDSYFKQTGTGNTGSIAGEVQGTIESVYTDAVIEGTGLYVGGIAAYTCGTIYDIVEVSSEMTTDTAKTVTATAYRDVVNIKNCWFDGVINATTEETWARIGGLVGYVSEGRLDMANCLFTGKIDAQKAAEDARVGGFVGTRSSSATPTTSTPSTTDGIKITTNITSTYKDTGEQAYPMLYLDSSIAAGEITVSENADAVGSAIGYVQYGKFTNVFVTRDTYSVTHKAVNTFKNQPIQTYNTDRLIGYCVEEKYGSKLDFANHWSMRISGVPIPKVFAEMDGVGEIVDPSTLTAELGLDIYWDGTLASAVDYGVGNYVVSYEATLEQYKTYLTALDIDYGFDPYTDNSESDMDDDGVYNAVYTKADGDWVLSVTFVQNEGKVYISISTVGEEGLSPYLRASDTNITLANDEGNVSFAMLELVDGNSFVFKLPNGHFIVNDGGKAVDAANLVAFLKEQAGQDKVVIDAWIFTHLHQDHCGAASQFFNDASLRAGIHVNGIYLSEPNLTVQTMDPTGEERQEAMDAFKGLMTLTQEDGVLKPAVYRMHMGERYYFSGMKVDVVQAQEQIPSDKYKQYNDPDYTNAMSTNCVYTLTKSGKKILLGGDSNNVNMQYMMMAYGKNYETYNPNLQKYGGMSTTLSNINVFAAYHHGKNAICTFQHGEVDGYDIYATATNEWADYLLKNTNNASGFKFDTVLFPYEQVFDSVKTLSFTTSDGDTRYTIYVGDDKSIVYPYNMSAINQYYIDNANAYYTYGYEDHDANGNIIALEKLTRHGTVQFIYKEDKSVELVKNESKITQ